MSTSTDRAGDVLDYIIHYACQHSIPPTQGQIADALGINKQRVSALMAVLCARAQIEWVTRYTYRIPGATWTPPPDPP